MTKALTAASVARLKAADDGVREIPDGGCTGLYLVSIRAARRAGPCGTAGRQMVALPI